MESTFREIDNIRHRNLVLGFTNEISYLKECGEDKDRIDQLKSIIDSLKVKNKPKKNVQNKGSYLDMFKEADTSVLKMPWKKIVPQYQEIKVGEYIDNLKISKDTKTKIKKLLIPFAKHGQLTHKIVKYNQLESKIEDITCLKYNKKTKKYTIDLEILKSLK